MSVRLYFTRKGFSLITSLFTIPFSPRSSRLSERTFDDIPPTASLRSLKPIEPDSSSLWIITGCHFFDIIPAVAVSGHQSLPAHFTGTFSFCSLMVLALNPALM